jgi:hypothetical protein
MNKTHVWLTIVMVMLSLTVSACSSEEEPTPAPTYTALPTYTPYPTLEPAPTYTSPPPAPTNTSAPPTPTAGAGAQCSGTPVISSFTANPTTIQVGQKSTLQYGLVSNAQAAALVSPEGRLGVATPGQTTVQPDQTTTYSLYAVCGSTVEVPSGCSGVPVIEAFTANPTTIAPGQTTKLQWGAVENASAAVLVAPEGKRGVATPGELVVEPNQTTTYALVAFCESDVTQRNVTVTVEGTTTCSGAPVIASFTADPTTIQKGQSTTLQWGPVSNASGAYVTDGNHITGIGTPGQLEVKPDQTTTYSLVAFCGGDIVLSDLTITVQ